LSALVGLLDLLSGLFILFFLLALLFAFLFFLSILVHAGMRHDDALILAVELENLKVERLIHFCLATVFLLEVTVRCKSFYAVWHQDNGAFLFLAQNRSFVDRTFGEYGFECIPWIFFNLLVTEGHLAVFLIDFEDHHLQLIANFRVFRWMAVTLGPGKIGDVDHAANTFFQLHKNTIGCNVLHLTGMLALHRIFFADIAPRVLGELLNAQ